MNKIGTETSTIIWNLIFLYLQDIIVKEDPTFCGGSRDVVHMSIGSFECGKSYTRPGDFRRKNQVGTKNTRIRD